MIVAFEASQRASQSKEDSFVAKRENVIVLLRKGSSFS